jgi:hypothetical protein
VLEVLQTTGAQVVKHNDTIAAAGKRVDEVRADKARAACD